MTYKNFVLGIDIDNTLILEVHHLYSHIRENIDSSFSYSDWIHWDLLKLFPENEQELIEFMKKYYSSDNIKNMDLMDYASDFLQKFDKKNIYYVTARSLWLFKDPLKESQILLKENGLPLVDKNLILQRDPSTKVKKCKSLIAKEKGINLFVEDNPENALKISKSCPVLLIDYPFNRKINSKQIKRIGKFDDRLGTWERNPWRDALEFLESGELEAFISSFAK